jgi:hypothetical protein
VSASFDGRGCYCCGANWATAVTSGRASSTVATATSATTTKLVRDASTRPCSHLQLSCRGRVWHECVLHRPFAIDATACASQVFPMAGSASTSFARSIGDRYRCKLARATSLETDGTAMRRLACCWLTRHDGIAHSLSCQDFSMLREGYDDSTFAGHLLDRRLIASAPRDSR